MRTPGSVLLVLSLACVSPFSAQEVHAGVGYAYIFGAGGFSLASGYLQLLNAPTSPLRRDLRTRWGEGHAAPHPLRKSSAAGHAARTPGYRPTYCSEPGVVSSSPVSSRVLRPESTIGQPPYSSECAFSRS